MLLWNKYVWCVGPDADLLIVELHPATLGTA